MADLWEAIALQVRYLLQIFYIDFTPSAAGHRALKVKERAATIQHPIFQQHRCMWHLHLGFTYIIMLPGLTMSFTMPP